MPIKGYNLKQYFPVTFQVTIVCSKRFPDMTVTLIMVGSIASKNTKAISSVKK